jgi:Glycosyltransferase
VKDLVFSGKHQLKSLVTQNKIILINYVDDKDTNVLYSHALAFICSSIYEGFGIPILEAMQSGTPVICSNTSSMPEIIGDCGIQIDPTNNENLIEALKKMYYHPGFRRRCSKKGLNRAKLFTWDKCVSIMTHYFKISST